MKQSESQAALHPESKLPWSIVWALSVTQIVSWGSIYYAISVLLSSIEGELGWSRDAVIGAFSLSLLFAALAAYPVGAWIDRHGGRWLMTTGSLIAAALLAAMSQVHSLTAFYLLWAGLGFCMAMVLYEPAFAVIAQSFGASARKGITALALSGGFAGTVFWPLTQWLVSSMGWRDALIALALCNLLLCAPLHALFLPNPQKRALSGKAEGKASAGASPGMREVLATPAFWLLAVAFTGNMLAFSGLSVHVIPLLTEKGFGMTEAVEIAALVGVMQVAGRVGELTIGARFRATQVATFALATLPVALLCLSYTASPWLVVLLFIAPYGASNGIMTITRGVIPMELFGRERYGAVNGALATPVSAARAFGPFMVSLIWSASGGYTVVLWSLAGVAVLSLAAFGFAARAGSKD
jgi:MFS family permease